MTSEPRTPAHDDQDLFDELHQLRTMVTGVRAVINVGRPNYKRRCEDATDALIRLLNLPGERPGSWEAPVVTRLEHELRDVLAVLEDDKAEGGR